jgi:hypothetical protein
MNANTCIFVVTLAPLIIDGKLRTLQFLHQPGSQFVLRLEIPAVHSVVLAPVHVGAWSHHRDTGALMT